MNSRSRLVNLLGLVSGFVLLLAGGCGSDRPGAPHVTDTAGKGGCTGTEIAALLEPSADPQQIADSQGWCLVRHDALANLAVFRDPTGTAKASFKEDPGGTVTIELNESIGGAEGIPWDAILGYWEGETEEGDILGGTGLEPTGYLDAHAYTEGRGMRIAVIDTGINPEHPGFEGRIEYGSGDKNDARDIHGHGTAVAGIIHQMAPRATIQPINVFDGMGYTYPSDVISGLAQAWADGADIVNLSLRFNKHSPGVAQKIAEMESAGVVIVCAAGNQTGPQAWPASDPKTTSVTSTNVHDSLADGVASGSEFGAPGVGIYSYGLHVDGLPTWVRATGTSMACAATSGLIALYIDRIGLANYRGAFITAAKDNPVHPLGSVDHGRIDGSHIVGLLQNPIRP